MTILGSLFDGGHIPNTGDGHIQRTGNGGGRKSKHIDVGEKFLKTFFVFYAEPLFFVYNRKAQILKNDVFLNQSVSSDNNINFSIGQLTDDFLLLLWGTKTGENLDVDRKPIKPFTEGLIVLPGQDCRGAENCTLLPVHYTFESSPHGDFGFAKSHIAAEYPIHGMRTFHIRLDFFNGFQLIISLNIGKPLLKVRLPFGVLGKRKTRRLHPAGIELDQLVGNILDRFFCARAGFLPFRRMKAVQLYVAVIPGADIFGDQIQLGDWDVKSI